MSESAKKPEGSPKVIVTPTDPTERKLLVVAAAICQSCTRPILPRDLGAYAGTPMHRVCALELRLEDAESDIGRLNKTIDELRGFLFPGGMAAH